MQLIPEMNYENNLLGNPDYIEELIYGGQVKDFDDGQIYRSLDREYFLNGGITSSALRFLTRNMDETVIDYAFKLLANQDSDLIQQEISEYSFFLKIIQLIRKGEAVWLGLMRLFPDLNEETDIDQLYMLYKEVIGHYFHDEYSSGKWDDYFSSGNELFSVLTATGLIEITSAISPGYDIGYDFHCDGYEVTKMYAARDNLRYSQIGEYGYIRDIDSENLRIEKAVIKYPCFTTCDSVNHRYGKNDLKLRFEQAEIDGRTYPEIVLVLCNAVIVPGPQHQPDTEPVNRSYYMSIAEFMRDGCKNAKIVSDPSGKSMTITGTGFEYKEYSSLYASFNCRYESIKLFSDEDVLKKYMIQNDENPN